MKTTVSAIDVPGSLEDFQLASAFVGKVYTQLREFHDTLEEDEYIRTYIVLSSGERIWPNLVTYHNPDALKIIGVDGDGLETRIFTHKANIQFVMKKHKNVKGEGDDEEKQQGRKIGFHTAEGEYST